MFFRFLISAVLVLPALCFAGSNFSTSVSADDSFNYQSPKPAIYSPSDQPAFQLASMANSEIVITNRQYIAGGILGIIPGLGVGHAIQNRWRKTGWIFTTAPLAIALITVLTSDSKITSTTIPIPSRLAIIAFRIWEIIDVWAPPSYVKIVGEKEKQKPFSASPHLYTHNNHLYKGIKFQFHF